MESKYLLTQIIELGEKMRKAQKDYFLTNGLMFPDLKSEHLASAVRYEKQFDKLMIEAKKLVENQLINP